MPHTQSVSTQNHSFLQTHGPAAEPVFRLLLLSGEVVVRPGDIPADLKTLLAARGAQTWAFLSARNPHSLTLSKEANRQRHQTLCRLLDDEGYAFVPAQSLGYEDGYDGVLVFDILPRQADSLARAFAQCKYLYGDREQARAAYCEALDFAI